VERHSARALLPLLPVAFLMAGHPSLPTRSLFERLVPSGLEVFTAMLAGAVLTIAVAAPDRVKATRAMLDGMAFAFAHIVTLIAVSAGVAKALEVAGVLGAFVGVTAGHPSVALGIAFALAFSLAALSGSGSGPSVALVTALGPRAAELGVPPLALGAALLFGAEAGRTTSPVAAVVLFGGSLVAVPARVLSRRLVLPCLAGGIAGAIVCIARAR
jgi:DcuC family C4-dicarboxylate transporter